MTGDFRATCHVCGIGTTYLAGKRVDSRCPHRVGVEQPPTILGTHIVQRQGVYTAFCWRCGTEGKAWCWRSRDLAVIRKEWDKHEHHHNQRPAKRPFQSAPSGTTPASVPTGSADGLPMDRQD